jgi:hypothetical protein
LAQETEAQITEETSERVERITLAMAKGEAITEEDALWIADFNEKQAVIQSALNEGRRIQEEPIQLDDGRHVIQWTEFLPMPDGEVLMRRGTDIITNGVFGIEVTRTASYYNPNDPMRVGMIESVISGGKEEVTRITGDIFGDLQIGDTRPSPIPSTGLAGVRPSSWDPASGKFGFASGGSNPSGGSQTPSDTTSPNTQSPSDTTEAAGLGSPGMGRTDGVDPIGESAGSTSGAGDQGGSDGGDKMGDTVDADPGTEDQGGSDEGDPMPEEGTDPEAGSFGDEAGGGGDEPATPQGEVTVGEGQIEVGTFYTQGEDSDTYEYPSGDTVEIPHDTGGGGGGGGDTDGDSEEEYHASDDYYSAGSAEIPPPGSGGTVDKAASGRGGGGSGGYSMSWEQWQAQQAATWSDPNWNPEGAPIDYGDTTDPNYDPVSPDPTTPQDDPNTQILVDPSFYEQSEVRAGIELDMVGALENTGNPLDENQSLAPGGGMPNTGEQEYIGGDGFAATSPEMAGAVGEESPEQEGLGAMGGDDPLP